MFTFIYKANVFDCIVDNKAVYLNRCGILYAEDFTRAVQQLEKYYGTNLESFEISCYDVTIFEFPEANYEQVKNYIREME